jgi:hypothetical protein
MGSKRVFAAALEWPGWVRAGKDEAGALAALAAAAPRYGIVAAEAGVPFPAVTEGGFEVLERVTGGPGTDFGVPGQVAARDREPLTEPQAAHMAALVAATWTVFDRVAAAAPLELRKGPRGGGRDRDKIVRHVYEPEADYANKMGIRARWTGAPDRAAVLALRAEIFTTLSQASDGSAPVDKGWPPRYAARRIAWHVLDHTWEIQDRSQPQAGGAG